MSDPFVIDGPAVISVSGGRTSAYMLRRILDARDVCDEDDVHVLFANTGKEREETLRFINDVMGEWGVWIVWLERTPGGGYHVVTFDTASRHGEPFEALIHERKFLPNPVTRFCTQELKIRPMRDWMRAHGYEHWTNVVGIRSDEPRRVARMREAAAARSDQWDIALPLADGGVTLLDVEDFWSRQPFDLRLRPDQGNCDLCFLKGARKRARIAREEPERLIWWAQQEADIGAHFRNDTPAYAHLLDQLDLFDDSVPVEREPDLIECYCHD